MLVVVLLTLTLILRYVYLVIIMFKLCLSCCNCWADAIVLNSDLESKLERLLPKQFMFLVCNQYYLVCRNNQCTSANLVSRMYLYILRDKQATSAAASSSNILHLTISICCACRTLHFVSSCWRCIECPWGLSDAEHHLFRIEGVICDSAIHRHRSVCCRHCFIWHGFKNV